MNSTRFRKKTKLGNYIREQSEVISQAFYAVSKDELLDETKRLLQEHIMVQIKANQISFKKPRNTKKKGEKTGTH